MSNQQQNDNSTNIDNYSDSNYEYWREHGAEWAEEYDNRKEKLVYYHIQELMLIDYFSRSAPARVLEYGCGVGRHLSYLSKIPDLETYGYDQSSTMTRNCLRWTSQDWLNRYVTVGEPVSKLPYPDQYFDITLTVEVLIHVRPSDLEFILAELIRVSRWHILHLEPSPQTQINMKEHRGCWGHDIVLAYQKMGYSCELLTSGFEMQSPYRVMLSTDRQPYTWSSIMLALLRRVEHDLQPTLNRASEQCDRAQAIGMQLATEQVRTQELSAQLAAEQIRTQELSAQLAAEQIRTQELSAQFQQKRQELENLLQAQQNRLAQHRLFTDQLDALVNGVAT